MGSLELCTSKLGTSLILVLGHTCLGMWLWLSTPLNGIPFWLGLVNSPSILEPILVVGLGCSLGANRDFDPWPCTLFLLVVQVGNAKWNEPRNWSPQRKPPVGWCSSGSFPHSHSLHRFRTDRKFFSLPELLRPFVTFWDRTIGLDKKFGYLFSGQSTQKARS